MNFARTSAPTADRRKKLQTHFVMHVLIYIQEYINYYYYYNYYYKIIHKVLLPLPQHGHNVNAFSNLSTNMSNCVFNEGTIQSCGVMYQPDI